MISNDLVTLGRWIDAMTARGPLRPDQARVVVDHLRVLADDVAALERAGRPAPASRPDIIDAAIATMQCERPRPDGVWAAGASVVRPPATYWTGGRS